MAEPKDVVTPTVTQPNENQTVVKPEETKVDPKQIKNEVLRDLSKELGINVFEAEGLKQVKELIDSQKSEQEKLQEQLEAYKTEKANWDKKSLEYESKLKASELGIASDKLEDALKLAGNDPTKLEEVIKKYPIFKSNNDISIGIHDPQNSNPPTDMSEVEAYMAKDPRYKRYLKTK